MNVVDIIRVESAVTRYDFWLELRGASRRSRRTLRRELRDNLKIASGDVGTTQALFGIGSPKELAYAVTGSAASRPRWSTGMIWASVAFGLTLVALVFTSLVFMQGVQASNVLGQDVSGHVFPWFGTTFHARAGDGVSFGFDAPFGLLIVPLFTFVVVAQPWRLLHASGRRTP